MTLNLTQQPELNWKEMKFSKTIVEIMADK